jgi:hypothetical protein
MIDMYDVQDLTLQMVLGSSFGVETDAGACLVVAQSAVSVIECASLSSCQ